MGMTAIEGEIERRVLVNFRVDADVMTNVLPEPFAIDEVDGYAIAGVCLIRLGHIHPAFVPGNWGFGSENAAHRVAVRLPGEDVGVYIPRRDSSSHVTTLLGGRAFPGVHHHALFCSVEHGDYIEVAMQSDDEEVKVAVAGHVVDELPDTSIFPDLDAASAFFERGSLGYSDTGEPDRFDGLVLDTDTWEVEPLEVHRVWSTWFADTELFPSGSVHFDNALLMRNTHHRWLEHEPLCCGA